MTKNVKDQKWREERQTKYDKTVKTTTWSKNVFENTSFEMTDETSNNPEIIPLSPEDTEVINPEIAEII